MRERLAPDRRGVLCTATFGVLALAILLGHLLASRVGRRIVRAFCRR